MIKIRAAELQFVGILQLPRKLHPCISPLGTVVYEDAKTAWSVTGDFGASCLRGYLSTKSFTPNFPQHNNFDITVS